MYETWSVKDLQDAEAVELEWYLVDHDSAHYRRFQQLLETERAREKKVA